VPSKGKSVVLPESVETGRLPVGGVGTAKSCVDDSALFVSATAEVGIRKNILVSPSARNLSASRPLAQRSPGSYEGRGD
jgi:hypothetical protein